MVSMIILLILLILILIGVYMVGCRYFEDHFYRGTTVNGVNASLMTVDDVKYALQDKIRDYTLTCDERNGVHETITGDEIYMQYVDDGSLEELMESQNAKLWPIAMIAGGKHYETDIGFDFEESAVDSVMDEMACFQSENIIAAENAHVDYDGSKYVVVEAKEGTTLDREKTKEAIISAIKQGETEIDFDALGLYQDAEVSSDSSGLQEQADALNKMLETDIKYELADKTYEVDGETVKSFIVQDSDGNYNLDESKVRSWVNQMALETDTFGLEHKFTTHTGKEITLAAGGDYGWATNVDETTSKLVEGIKNAVQETRDPVYTYTAQDRSSNDIGGTYVEICITEQKMYCYKDNQLVVETDVVTGNHANGTDTPSGSVWAIDAKMSDTRFKASGNVHVDYWLPFNGGCGIHDSSWRSSYGGDIWKTNGSHGCVNTPHDAAGKIFEVMEIGMPVIVYYSEDQVVGPQPTGTVTVG